MPFQPCNATISSNPSGKGWHYAFGHLLRVLKECRNPLQHRAYPPHRSLERCYKVPESHSLGNAGRGTALGSLLPSCMCSAGFCPVLAYNITTDVKYIHPPWKSLLALNPRATLTCTPGPSSRRVKCMAQEQAPRSSRRPGPAHSWPPFTAAQHARRVKPIQCGGLAACSDFWDIRANDRVGRRWRERRSSMALLSTSTSALAMHMYAEGRNRIICASGIQCQFSVMRALRAGGTFAGPRDGGDADKAEAGAAGGHARCML